jgi:hypothetical protein
MESLARMTRTMSECLHCLGVLVSKLHYAVTANTATWVSVSFAFFASSSIFLSFFLPNSSGWETLFCQANFFDSHDMRLQAGIMLKDY